MAAVIPKSYFAPYQNLAGETPVREMYSSRPIVGNRGIITGYTNPVKQPGSGTTVSPLPPVYDPTRNRYEIPSTGTPRWDGSKFVNEMGQAFTGTYGGQTYTNGQSQQQLANSPSRYAALSVTKNEPVANITDTLLNGFKPSVGITDFSSLLDSTRKASGAIDAAYNKDRNAYDIQPFADTLNSLNTNYARAGANLNSRYSDILRDTASNQNNVLRTATDLLPQQYDSLRQINNQYADTTGNITSGLRDNLGRTEADQNALVARAYGMLPEQYNALQSINDNFAATGGALNDRYSGLINTANTRQDDIIKRANDLLGNYDQAANNIGDAQTKSLVQGVSRYKLSGGTPMGLGGGEEKLLADGVANIRLPLERDKINQRYSLLQNLELPIAQQQEQAGIGQLQNFSLPLASNIADRNYNTRAQLNSAQNDILRNMELPLEQQQSRDRASLLRDVELPLADQISQRNYNTQAGLNSAQQNLLQNIALPLATQQGNAQVQQLTNFTAPQAQQDYTNAATTAQTIQNLKLQTAGMDISAAIKYLQAMAVPIQIQQQILASNQALQSGDISNLSALNNLYSGSRYQGLQDTFGVNTTAPSVTTFNAGSYPTGTTGGNSRYAALNNPTSTAAPAPAAPESQLPQGAWAQTLQPAGGNLYRDPKTGSLYRVENGKIYPYNVSSRTNNSGYQQVNNVDAQVVDPASQDNQNENDPASLSYRG